MFTFTLKKSLFLAVLGPHWVAGFSLVAVSGGSSLAAVLVLLIAVASFHGAQALGHTGSVVVAHRLVSPHHVGSSWIRD